MKTLTKVSNIERVRQQNLSKEEEICKMLAISKPDYCQHQYNCYESFIMLVTDGLPLAKLELRYSPVFRGFFNSEWCFRNENEFMPFATDLLEFDLDLEKGIVYAPLNCGDEQIREEYKFIHSPNRLYHDDDFIEKYAMIIDHILSTTR